jgi:DNA-binding MarR family transcriptional regulator
MARARPAAVGRDGDPPHDRTLLFAMVRLVDLTARPFQEGIGRRHRLGLSEWRVLAALHGDAGTAAIEIARRTGLDKMSVSRALASLEAAGRIARRPDPDDGRRVLASLTPAGRTLYRSLQGPSREREAAATGALSVAERRQLMTLMRRMTDSVRSADAGG